MAQKRFRGRRDQPDEFGYQMYNADGTLTSCRQIDLVMSVTPQSVDQIMHRLAEMDI